MENVDIDVVFESKNQKPHTFYTGSLFVNNFKELNDLKGLTLIDLEKDELEFIPIDNNYQFKIINLPEYDKYTFEWLSAQNIHNKSYVRFIIEDSVLVPIETYKKIVREDLSKFNPLYFDFITKNYISLTATDINEESGIELTQLNTAEAINKIIIAYADEFGGQDIVDRLCQITVDAFPEIRALIPNDQKINYTLNSFNFSNTFSYGNVNDIKFDKEGLIGIFGKNKNGKSGFLNSLFYGIFGDTYKGFANNDIVNSNRDSCGTSVVLSDVSSNKYFISRSVKRGKSAKRTVDFYINETSNSRNGDSVTQTDTNIQSYLGDLNQFKVSNFSFQGKLTEILEKENSDRKKAFLQFFDLKIFEILYTHVNELLKSSRANFKAYVNMDFTDAIESSKKNIENYTDNIGDYNIELGTILPELESKKLESSKLVQDITRLEESIKDTNKTRKKLIEEQLSIIQTVNNNKTLIENLESSNYSIELKTQSYREALSLAEKLRDSLESELNSIVVDATKVEMNKTLTEELAKLEVLITGFKKDIESTNKDINRHSENVKILNTQSWMNTLDQCKKCTLASNAFSSESELKNLTATLQSITDEIQNIQTCKSEFNTLLTDTVKEIENNNRKINLESKINANNKIIQTNSDFIKKFELSILENFQKINNYTTENDTLLNRSNLISVELSTQSDVSEVETEISQLKLNLSEIQVVSSNIEKEVLNLNKSIVENETLIGVERKNIIEYTNNLQMISDLEKEIKIYETYIAMMHKDGLPLRILKQLLKNVERVTNDLLISCSDLKIEFDINNDSFDIYYYDGKDNSRKNIYLVSGQEGVFIGLAVRCALAKLNTKSKVDFMVIDEGMGALDSENLINVRKLFEMIKSNFRFVLLITHLDSIKDYVDYSITVERKNEFSALIL